MNDNYIKKFEDEIANLPEDCDPREIRKVIYGYSDEELDDFLGNLSKKEIAELFGDVKTTELLEAIRHRNETSRSLILLDCILAILTVWSIVFLFRGCS